VPGGDLARLRLVQVCDGDEPRVGKLMENSRVARAEYAGADDGDAGRSG
jgi:hypothetical protein